MAQRNTTPKIRFAGFSEDWEERKLGDVAEFNPKSVVPERFEYVDLESVVGTELIGHRKEAKTTAPSRAQRLAKNGDIFYQTVRPYQKNNYLFNLHCDNYVFSTGYAQIRPYIDSLFLFSRLQEERFVKAVLDRCTGTSYPAINSNKLADIDIQFPTENEEQLEIGQLFATLDNLITQHQREHEQTANIKKAILEKMFPKAGATTPEIRFAGFSGDWQQKKLGDIARFINGRAYSQNELLSAGKYKVLRVGNFYTNESWYYSDMELGEKYYANTGDLLYTWSASFGPHIWLGGKVIYHYHIWKVELSEVFDKQFAVQVLEYDKAKILSDSNGSTMIHITKNGMEEKFISLPSVEEQQKIGQFFASLDRLLSLQQRRLAKLKSIKLALLENMFV